MSAIDQVRRVVTVLLVAASLLVAPQIAFAGFSTPQQASLSVSTATLAPPTSLQGSRSCTSNLFREKFDVDVTSFVQAVPPGRTLVYTITLLRENVPVDTYSGGSRSASLGFRGPLRLGGRDGSYTLQIGSALGNWTSPVLSYPTECTDGKL